jgi:threonine/homoserine/homoserine lactone efflux protein
MRGGRRAGLITACGTMSGLTVWAIAAAVGLTALVRVSHVGYDVLRFAGAAYLIWLGVSSLGLVRRRGAGRAAPAALERPPPGPARPARAYLNGLLSNLFNPKIGVFFVAFLPGFIPARASAAVFSLVLGLWFIIETGAWLVILAWMVARGVGWLRGSGVQRWAERVTGVVLIGFGLRLAAETR